VPRRPGPGPAAAPPRPGPPPAARSHRVPRRPGPGPAVRLPQIERIQVEGYRVPVGGKDSDAMRTVTHTVFGALGHSILRNILC
jgi:hypothetical protein